MVEREPVALGLTDRSQIGRHFLRLVAARTTADVGPDHLGRYGFTRPTGDDLVALESEPEADRLLRALAGRVIDGAELVAEIADGQHAAFVGGLGLGSTEAAAVLDAAAALVAWASARYSIPAGPVEDAWSPAHLEYQLALAADAEGGGQTVLEAGGYHGGRLDWYSFDVAERHAEDRLVDAEGVEIAPAPPSDRDPVATIPTPIEFGGMPNARWWEFEDRRTDFGGITAATTDIGTLLVTELAMAYGNDWSVLPIDLPVGSLTEVLGVVVTDSFGRHTLVEAAGSPPDQQWQRWSMFDLTAAVGVDHRLFLAPALVSSNDSEPIERVLFARDEMANLVWAVEDRVPGIAGSGVDGNELAGALSRLLADRLDVGDPGEEERPEADVRYRLGTTVPGNWIPFVPARQDGSDREIALQRAAMPRTGTVDPDDVVTPSGRILRPPLPPEEPYLVNEEEVPRGGAIVTRAFQRSRGVDGSIHLWLGRRKRTGRGGAVSGLRFDQLEVGE
ncbi:MAG: hypothetical protein ACFCVK_19670 [Acidimicrobiales bacterium]